MLKVIKTWNISEVGWQVYDTEVRELSRGRSDVELKASAPGKLMLIERPLKVVKTAARVN